MSVPGGWLSGEPVWMNGRIFGLLCLQRMNDCSFIEKFVGRDYSTPEQALVAPPDILNKERV